MKKEQLSGNWRTRRMAVLICTRSLELKVPSGALINLGVREERRFLERDREERERGRGRDSCYRRTRSPQDVIAEQTEGPRTISINEIYTSFRVHFTFSNFLLLHLLPSFPFEKGMNIRCIYRFQIKRIRNSVSSKMRMWGTRAKDERRSSISRENFLKSAEDVFVGTEREREREKGKEDRAFHPELILLPSWRGYGGRRADSGRSYHFSGGDWPRGGWRMRTGCPLPLPTLTFLTSLLAALFARDRLCEAFLDRHCLYRLLLFLPICSLAAASLPNRNFFPFSSHLTMETNVSPHLFPSPLFFFSTTIAISS